MKILNSKKATEMIMTQVILVIVLIAILWIAGGDAEKVNALIGAVQPLLYSIAGIGGVTVAAQGIVDSKKP